MGGSYEEALRVPLETYYRYMKFADEEQLVKTMEASNAKPE